jgi:hypothetical protein
MININDPSQDGFRLFMNVADKIPSIGNRLEQLSQEDVWSLQKLSKATQYDGFIIFIAVDYKTEKLVIEAFLPHHKNREIPPFEDFPRPLIYIGNDVAPEAVMKELQTMCDRYYSLNPPSYERVKVTANGYMYNTSAHNIFMRDHGMHRTFIPSDYNQR